MNNRKSKRIILGLKTSVKYELSGDKETLKKIYNLYQVPQTKSPDRRSGHRDKTLDILNTISNTNLLLTNCQEHETVCSLTVDYGGEGGIRRPVLWEVVGDKDKQRNNSGL